MSFVNQGDFALAEKEARAILARQPMHALAQKALSFALLGFGRCSEAVPVLNQAIRQMPSDGELYNNLGIAQSLLMRWEESYQSFTRARLLLPDDFEVHKNVGLALLRMHRRTEAVNALLVAIEKHPDDYLEAIALLSDCLFELQRYDEAMTCYEELFRADAGNLHALSQIITMRLRLSLWAGLDERLHLLRTSSDNFFKRNGPPLSTLSFPGVVPEEHLRVAMTYSDFHTQLSRSVDIPKLESTLDERDVGRRLRVGYLSGDLRVHPVGWVIAEVLERHDCARFAVFAYSTMADDGSEIARRLRQAVTKYVDLSASPMRDAVEAIRHDNIDVLIDLSGWTANGRPEVLFQRCAPVQTGWLGYPGTMGHVQLLDYIIGDGVVTPKESQSFFVEHIAQLPGFYLPFDTTQAIDTAPTRAGVGLPEEAFVYCSFNGNYKYNPEVFDLWCEILSAAKNSVLWLGAATQAVADRLRQEVAQRCIAGERLIFANRVADRAGYLAQVSLADLALDPFPYNSHSTGLDALWAGVPMVSLLGETFAARVGASMLETAGLPDLVAKDRTAYRDLALAAYRDPALLRTWRQRGALAKTNSALFDMGFFTRELESLYSRMWSNHLRGEHGGLFLER
ncbi:MAG: tetratricopeptide repeat protein [Rhodocyclaceae bacterium]|nr:tetratricopeptide repeat protein [Rhodocyclaceae bacterium]